MPSSRSRSRGEGQGTASPANPAGRGAPGAPAAAPHGHPHGARSKRRRNPSARGLIEIGVVGRAHGIRGEVHIRPHNRDSTALADLEVLFFRRCDETTGEPAADPLKLTVERARSTPDGSWLVALGGVVTRTDAETLRGAVVSALRADMPPPEPDELYVEELEGMAAVDPEGRPLGVVREIYSNGAQEVLIVATDRGNVEVPFVAAHVGEVDVAARRLVILDLGALIPEP